MRTTLTLDDDIAEAAQALARATGKTLGSTISELVRRGIRGGGARSKPGRIPTFAVEDADEIIPGDRAARILAEEP